jgi:hypothetical protein
MLSKDLYISDSIDINIFIRNINDIFRPHAFYIFEKETLNREIEEYIFKMVKNHPVNKTIKLIIHIHDKRLQDEVILKDTLHNHFIIRANETEAYLKQQFRLWKGNMIIGVLFLFFCLILTEVLDNFFQQKFFVFIKESLGIVGWVALWEPLTFVLFGWRSIQKDINYFRKLGYIQIKVQ